MISKPKTPVYSDTRSDIDFDIQSSIENGELNSKSLNIPTPTGFKKNESIGSSKDAEDK